MFWRIAAAYRIVGRKFGVWGTSLVTLVLFGVLRGIVALGMALDPVFSPRLRRTRIRAPIFVVGNPRTGTTFLHRFLDDEGLAAGCQLYGMLYPSVVLRTALRPLLPALEKLSPAKFHNMAAHETSLTSVETDDVALLFRYFDGFFLYGFLFAWDDAEHRAYFDPKLRDCSERDWRWLRAVWRRNLAFTGGDRLVAKLFSAGPRLRQLLDAFPDGKVLYMVRDPVSTIPSTLSLVSGVLDARFGFWSLPADVRQAWVDRMYDGLVDLMRRFHDDWVDGTIPRDKVMVVTYPRLMQDFDGLMTEMLGFLDIDPSAELTAKISDVAGRQRAYKSEHKYDLEIFGLSEDKIRRDCAFVYHTFLDAPDPAHQEISQQGRPNMRETVTGGAGQ